MPGKGKILMGKGPVKRPTPVKPKPKAMPMPKAKPGKPAPKGGKVIERKIQDNKNIKGGNVPYLPGKPSDIGKDMPSFIRKTKPARRRVDLNKVGVAYGKSKKQVKTFRGR